MFAIISSQPFAVLSWGCKLQLPDIDAEKIKAFIKEKALTSAEASEEKEGQFDTGLLHGVGADAYEVQAEDGSRPPLCEVSELPTSH